MCEEIHSTAHSLSPARTLDRDHGQATRWASGGGAFAVAPRVAADAKRFVYVLQSLSQPDRQFVESATHVSARVAAHNAGHSPLTASARPWRLVAVVQFATEGSALRFEKFLKTHHGRTLVRQYFAPDDSTGGSAARRHG